MVDTTENGVVGKTVDYWRQLINICILGGSKSEPPKYILSYFTAFPITQLCSLVSQYIFTSGS